MHIAIGHLGGDEERAITIESRDETTVLFKAGVVGAMGNTWLTRNDCLVVADALRSAARQLPSPMAQGLEETSLPADRNG